MVLPENPYTALSLQLLKESSPENRCPYLKVDGRNISCRNCTSRVQPTDTASLQLWCLADPESHKRCIFYKDPNSQVS